MIEKAPSMIEKAPKLLQPVLKHALQWMPNFDSPTTTLVIVIISLIPLIMLLRGISGYLSIYCMQWVSVRTVTDLRNRLFNHLMNLSLNFFHRASTGDLISRISNDTSSLQTIISNTLPVIIAAPVTIVSLSIWLLAEEPQLTLLALVACPLCLAPILIYARKMRKGSSGMQKHYAELSKMMHESFTGNRIIKAYNLESIVEKDFLASSKTFIGHYMRVVRSSEIPGPLIEFVGSIGVALILFFIVLGHTTRMPAEEFFGFIMSVFMMYQPIKQLTRVYHQLVQARAASERAFQLLELKPTVAEPAHPAPLVAGTSEIHFDDIDFRYDEKPVLRGIQLKVSPGKIVALVGSSGSGKTTLTSLLLRFYDPQKGAVRINGTDIRCFSLRDLRNSMAVVTQETILFNDTIRNNIALGRTGATNEEIITAAKNAYAHDFIMEKSEGYDSVVGEKGISLSGGQRQRIAIARALLRDAPILILDEATSSLDTESERAVQAALEQLMKGRTTICIAHRLSTIQKADLIAVLEQGQIVEMGRHNELLQRGGVYQKLHSLQFENGLDSHANIASPSVT